MNSLKSKLSFFMNIKYLFNIKKMIIIFLVVATDYDCLSQMNTAALDKYNQMHRRLQHVNNSIRTINDTNCK
jgi:hypothetical protein